MRSGIERTDNVKTYPCLVVEKMTGDGSDPTVFLKPNAHTSIVVVIGHFARQMGYGLGHVVDSHDEGVQYDRDVKPGDPIDEDMPLFNGRVILEN